MSPFELSEQFVEEFLAVSPMTMTSLGIPGADHRWNDFSPRGEAQRQAISRKYRLAIEPHLNHSDHDQRHAAEVLKGYLDTNIAQFESGDYLRDINHIYCPFTRIRDIFDIMPRDSAAAWANIASRLATLSEPFQGWLAVLAEGRDQGVVAARRQVESIIDQAESLAGADSTVAALVSEASELGFLTDELGAAAAEAKEASAELARWLASEYLDHAAEADGVGEERYVRSAERFLGMVIDPRETYEWGWDEVARLQAEMIEVARLIDPALTLGEVIDLLENDASHAVSRDDFTDFVQHRLDQAVAHLSGQHFDVPEPAKRITVNLAPPGGALGAWYINPSVDWERPGSVWYALGSQTEIPVWQEISTAYHEGFPGHHLQVGTSMFQSDHLSKAHRLFVWYSGYGEGWALYAERLMDELGYFEKPEWRLGMLATQIFRAVRVVVDVGCHLGYQIPTGAPLHAGETWNFERGVDYIEQVGLQARDVAESEVKRYLGWPGQAISYKVGEREILAIRRELEARGGFDLKDFHRRVLEGGELRLDHLRRRMLG